MTITTDSNLFDKIDTEVLEGKLHLDQLKWIQASQKINIKIGAPNLRRVETGTHETLQIINIDSDYLNVMICNVSCVPVSTLLKFGAPILILIFCEA